MQIIVQSRHTELSPRLRDRATEKFERVTKFLDGIRSIEVAVGEEKNPRVGDRKNHIEVRLSTDLRQFHAEAYGPDVLTAVDAAVAKIEAQIRRVKGKVIDRARRNGGHAAADLEAARVALNGSSPIAPAPATDPRA